MARTFIAGHRGMVGSAIARNLTSRGYDTDKLLVRTRQELDLTDQRAVETFFAAEQPEIVYLAAAMVGGIYANNHYPADFIRENLVVQSNVIHSAYVHGVQRLLFLGSSCIYPRVAPQPLEEASLLSGPLEPTNRPYAVAKIAGIEMCWSYNRQFATKFLAVMPTNLYGPGDNYHPENSHVVPALIRRFHAAKNKNTPSIDIWGSGRPRREFMYVDDMADACVHLMQLPDDRYEPLLASDRNDGLAPIVNIGVGRDITIAELATAIAETVGYRGRIQFDPSKPDGPPQKLLNCARLGDLGWQATTDLSSGLVITYDDFVTRQLA